MARHLNFSTGSLFSITVFGASQSVSRLLLGKKKNAVCLYASSSCSTWANKGLHLLLTNNALFASLNQHGCNTDISQFLEAFDRAVMVWCFFAAVVFCGFSLVVGFFFWNNYSNTFLHYLLTSSCSSWGHKMGKRNKSRYCRVPLQLFIQISNGKLKPIHFVFMCITLLVLSL